MRLSERNAIAEELAEQARGHGEWRRVNCPFCVDRRGGTPDRTRNWCVNVATGFYKCWRCDIKGRLPGFEDDDPEATERFQADPAAPGPDLGPPESFRSVFDPDPELHPARRYLRSRGITKTIAREAGIGVCDAGDAAGRVVVPIYGPDGRTWVGWSARLYTKAWGPKYLYAEGMDRAHILYNSVALARDNDTPVLLVEGVFDALPYWPDASAFLGKPSKDQLPLLTDSKRPLVVCLDGDSWAEGEMWCARLRFEGCPRVGWVHLPPKQDPNTVDKAWLCEEAAKSLV